MSTNETINDKANKYSEEENGSTAGKSPDDLEVDNILSHPKVEHQNAEHRTNHIVSI